MFILTGLLFVLVFPEFTTRVSNEGGALIIGFILLPFTAVMEAFILALFGNTPAKAILKTKITNAEGNNLSFVEAIKRSFYIYFAGYAIGLPLIPIITYLWQYNRLKKKGKTSWDESGGFIVSHGHIEPVRTTAFILLFILLIGFIGILSSLDSLPKSLQDMTQKKVKFTPVDYDPFKGERYSSKAREPKSFSSVDEELNHLNSSYHFNSGINYYKDKKYYDAIESFSKAISNQSNAEIYTYRGLAYYKIGKPEEAIKDFTRATEIDPSYERSFTYRGHVYYENGQHEKAIEDYSRVIKINPSNKMAYYNRGINYLKVGQDYNALVDFRNACYYGDENGCKEWTKLNAIRGY